MILDRFFKKKQKPEPVQTNTKLPEDLERFRFSRQEFEKPIHVLDSPRDPFIHTEEPREIKEKNEKKGIHPDKIELVLQKLDTIDARLRFVEEKVKRL